MRVQPYTLSLRAASTRGRVAVERLERLRELVDGGGADGSSVDVELVFGRDGDGRCTMQGTATVTGRFVCSRCAQAVEHTLRADIDVTLVESDARAAELTQARDVMVLERDEADMGSLVEDDLLLSLAGDRCLRSTPCTFTMVDAADAVPATSGALGAALRDVLGRVR